MQSNERFNPYHLRYRSLGEEIERYRKMKHFSIEEVAHNAHLTHRTYASICQGTDFKLNYYLRLFWAFLLNSEQEEFLIFLRRFIHIAMQEVGEMMSVREEVRGTP